MTDNVYNEIALFNDMIGNIAGDIENPEWEGLDRQAGLIHEECVKELLPGVVNRDIKEVLDGCADNIVVTMGLIHRMGVDGNALMKEVNASNMSKFCKDMVEVTESIQMYADKGVPCTYRANQDMYAIVVDKTVTIGGAEYPIGKLMKGIKYFKPNIEQFMSNDHKQSV